MWTITLFSLISLVVLSSVSAQETLPPAEDEYQTQNGQLYCTKYGDIYEARFFLYRHDDTVNLIYAFDQLFQPMYDTCSNTNDKFIRGDGSNDDPFALVVTWYENGTVISDSSCGMYGQTAIKKYSWYVETRVSAAERISSILMKGDYNYNLECDFRAVTEHVAAKGSVTLAEGSIEVDRYVNNTVEDVDFYIADESGEPVTSVTFGQFISLQIKLNREDGQDGATGLWATDCRACSDSTCSERAEYYQISEKEGTGCVAGDELAQQGSNFFETPTSAVEKSSIDFPSFRFVGRGLNVVYFFCRINFCFGNRTDSINMCLAHECEVDGGNSTERKRRQAENQKSQEARTYVIINDEPTTSKITGDAEKVACRSVTMYMALTISLGILLIVSLCVTIAIFLRVRRLHLKNVGS